MSALLTNAAIEPESGQSKYLRLIESPNSYGYTPLLVAVLYGHVECVDNLLSAGADPNNRGGTDTSALTVATESGYIDIQNSLSNSRKGPSKAAGKEGCLPLYRLTFVSAGGLVRILCEAGTL